MQWQLEGTASSVFTDDNGCFSIPDLEPGQYRLLVTKEGYEDSGEMGVPVDEDTATVLLDDILLKRKWILPVSAGMSISRMWGKLPGKA